MGIEDAVTLVSTLITAGATVGAAWLGYLAVKGRKQGDDKPHTKPDDQPVDDKTT
jgi:hypothetical protein